MAKASDPTSLMPPAGQLAPTSAGLFRRARSALRGIGNSLSYPNALIPYPWEQRKLGDIATRINAMSTDVDLPRVEYEDINPGQGTLNKDLATKNSVKTGIEFEPGDVLYGKLRPYLMNWLYSQFRGIAVGDFWVLKPTNCDSSFLYRFIQSERFQYNTSISAGSKMPRADWAFVSEGSYLVPQSQEEQRQIGKVLEQLDSLITLHQRYAVAGSHPCINYYYCLFFIRESSAF